MEELHRKCPQHIRKPSTEKVIPSATGEAGEEKEEEDSAKEKPKEKEKDPKDKNDRRWERNGKL